MALKLRSDSKVPPLRAALRREVNEDVQVVGHGHSETGEPYVQLVITGRPVLVRVNNLIAHRCLEFARLRDLGARLLTAPAQRELIDRIEAQLTRKPIFRVATTSGGIGKRAKFADDREFMIEHFGEPRIEFYDYDADPHHRLRRCHGTREGAMELFALFRGNTRLLSGAALAFVGPLNTVVPLEHVALQFTGEEELMQTYAAAAISSIWGGDPYFKHRLGCGTEWENIGNVLEQWAAAYSNTLLFLDNCDGILGTHGSAKAAPLVNAVKHIARGRAKSGGNDPAVHSWFTPILSTAKVSVPQMLDHKHRPRDLSYIDALFDIPNPRGSNSFLENLHGFAHGTFQQRLMNLANHHYGWAGRAFEHRLASAVKKDRMELVAFVNARREAYLKAAESIPAPGRDVDRLHSKFATIYAAGCTAIRFQILPFSKDELRDAVLTCERDHIAFIAKELGLAAILG